MQHAYVEVGVIGRSASCGMAGLPVLLVVRGRAASGSSRVKGGTPR